MKAPIPGHRAISASAGTGKTFRLAHRYIELLALGVPPDRICALTFSRKAAGEIFESIVGYLSEAAGSPDQGLEIRKRLHLPEDMEVNFTVLLRRFVDSLHRLVIGTLDSFTVTIVRSFPAELGLAFDFGLLDDKGPEAAANRNRILDRLYDPHLADEQDMARFMEAYRLATFGQETKTIDRSLGDFIQKHREKYQLAPNASCWGVPERLWPGGYPWTTQDLDVFSLLESLEPWLDDLPAKLRTSVETVLHFLGTYESTAPWDDRALGNRVGEQLLEQMEDLAGGTAELEFNRKCYVIPEQVSRVFYDLLHRVFSIEIDRALQQTRGLHNVLQHYEQHYERQLRQTGQMTFHDAQYLLTAGNPYNGGTLLSRVAGSESRLFIDYRLDSQLDHWLLDEFQDTSSLQWAVLRNLVDEVVQDASGTRSFFYVGDIKQAIYGWRGGNARLFDLVEQAYKPAIVREPLNTSFRSGPAVIGTVNRLFENLHDLDLPPATIRDWENVWEEHSCSGKTAGLPGYAAVLEPPNDGKTHTPKETCYALAAALAADLDPEQHHLEIAILTRGNEAAAEMAERLRTDYPHLPVHLEGKAALLDNPVVALMLALVRCAAHPGDTAALAHLRMSPIARDVDTDSPDLPLTLLTSFQQLGAQGFVRHWAERLEQALELDPFGRLRLDELAELSGRFDANQARDPRAFIAFAQEAEIDGHTGGGGIRIMTIHQSKGLGFDVVILPELMTQGMNLLPRDPLLMCHRDEAALDVDWVLKLPRRTVAEQDVVLRAAQDNVRRQSAFEALCVFYVAATRARQALYMITGFKGPKPTSLSPGLFVKRQLLKENNPDPIDTLAFDGRAANILYETGDRSWAKTLHAEEQDAPIPPPLLSHGFARKVSRRIQWPSLEPSASDIGGEPAADLFSARRQHSFNLGTAVHELFEKLDWSDTGDAAAQAETWQASTCWPEDTSRAATDLFLQGLASGVIREALARPDAGAVELWRERSFEVVLDRRWVSGTFDRVVIKRDTTDGPAVGAEILDYKSNQVENEENLEELVEHYSPQLQLYRKALGFILGLNEKHIRCRLIFLRSGAVVEVV